MVKYQDNHIYARHRNRMLRNVRHIRRCPELSSKLLRKQRLDLVALRQRRGNCIGLLDGRDFVGVR